MSITPLRELGSELLAALLRVLDRIAGGLTSACKMLGIAVPLGAAVGSCHDASNVPVPVAQVAPPVVPAPPPDAAEGPRDLGKFRVTFYYVIGEAEADWIARKHEAKHAAAAAAKAKSAGSTEPVLAAVDPAAEPATPRLVTLFNKDCSSLAEVSPDFASALSLQGTGKLRDGRVINTSGRCKCPQTTRCYHVTNRKWGNAGTGRPLDPFRTVAVDPKQVKLGSLLYIPALDGMTMPGRPPVGGFVHDGCVAADDTGGGIDGKQIDLFVAKRAFYLGLARRRGSHAWAKHVRVMDGSKLCKREGGHVVRVGSASSI
jgi:3D (Asp-Asp-Asp) domain-containing protein